MFIENVKLSVSAMVSSKMRTLLSLLGIVIGVGAVVAILNLGVSATTSISESIASGGTNIISIFPQQIPEANDFFTPTLCQTLVNKVAGVEQVLPSMQDTVAVRYHQYRTSSTVIGTDTSYFDLQKLSFAEGKAFTDTDSFGFRQVVILGDTLSHKLFPYGEAVGKTVFLQRSQGSPLAFTVGGVLNNKEQGILSDFNSSAYIPFTTFNGKLASIPQVSLYTIIVKDGFNTITVSNQITAFMDSVVGSDAYNSFSPATLVKMASKVTGTLSLFLAAIAAISLLVGGIGIMNIMLVSVTERTKEIGIRKALGATPATIRGQFLIEAVSLTLFGGILGVGFGSLITIAVTTLAQWKFTLSVSSVLVALGFSMFVGIFFGWYPALNASRLDPIDALNYE